MAGRTKGLAIAALAGVCLAALAPARADGPPGHLALPVDYQRTFHSSHRHPLAITKPVGEITAADLRPIVSEWGWQFFYRYRLILTSDPSDRILSLSYADDQRPQLLGPGWRLTIDADETGAERVDVLSPRIGLYRDSAGWKAVVGLRRLVVRQQRSQNEREYVSEPDQHGWIWTFAARGPESRDPDFLKPVRLERPGRPALEFAYRNVAGRQLLERMRSGKDELDFVFNPAAERAAPYGLQLAEVILRSGSSVVGRWRFQYRSSANTGRSYLRLIEASAKRDAVSLRFSYRGLDSRYAQEEPVARDTVWQQVDSDPRFMLPEGWRIGRHPGLRFVNINVGNDSLIDLVHASVPLRAWAGSPTGGWREITDTYKPHRPFVTGGKPSLPTGAVFSGLYKTFRANVHLSTKGFQSTIVSYYRPSADGSRLEYVTYVCFPRVVGMQLKPVGGSIWACENSAPLHLQVPLQYESLDPWPQPRPGLHATERLQNQGAQFVDFSAGQRIGLYYVGMQYRDAVTGELLLTDFGVKHRDLKNCAYHYRTTWWPKKVDVYLCQAYWEARDSNWSDTYEQQHGDKSFWIRKDLEDDDKTPNGLYVLPWDRGAAYLAHYSGSRSVRFADLDDFDYDAFAIVHGRRVSQADPAVNRPEAREVFGLIAGLGKWVEVPKADALYPPDAFFERSAYSGRFADLDGNGADDAVVAAGPLRASYLNRGAGYEPRWVRKTDYDLPRRCDLASGDCQLVDLDGDGDLDLFVGDGRLVFINRGKGFGNRWFDAMTHFTDEQGRYRAVEAVP